MSPNRRRRPARPANAQPRRPTSAAAEFWRSGPDPGPGPPEPVVPAADPTALVRSLGDPPLLGQSSVTGHYVAEVVERAARLATALATAAGLTGE